MWSLLPNPESCLLLVEETPLKSVRASLPDALGGGICHLWTCRPKASRATAGATVITVLSAAAIIQRTHLMLQRATWYNSLIFH